MVHTEVLRQFNGDVSMDSANNLSTNTTGVSSSTTLFKLSDLVAFTSATLNITGTSNSPTTVNVTANGTTIVSTASPTAAATVSVSQQTHTTPLNAPTYVLNVGGGTASASVTATRENRL